MAQSAPTPPSLRCGGFLYELTLGPVAEPGFAVLALLTCQCSVLVCCHVPCYGGRECVGNLCWCCFQNELVAINAANKAHPTATPVGVTVNWARSVLETRSIDTPVQHLQTVLDAAVPLGLMFSGCTPDEGKYGCVYRPPTTTHHIFTCGRLKTVCTRNRTLGCCTVLWDALVSVYSLSHISWHDHHCDNVTDVLLLRCAPLLVCIQSRQGGRWCCVGMLVRAHACIGGTTS